ncbi:hypothetical protein PZA11_001234 [Diplocarpon coronariae]
MDFKVKYILRMKNTIANSLLKRTHPYPFNLIKKDETDINKWVKNKVSYLLIYRLKGTRLASPAYKLNKRILLPNYLSDFKEIAKFLIILKRPKIVPFKDFQKFKAKALIYLV